MVGGRKRLTNDEIDLRIKERHIKRLSDYTIKSKNTDKLKWECLVDGHIWEASVANIIKGRGCPKCSGNLLLNNELIDNQLTDKIKRLSEYPGRNNIKMKWECLVDGHIWEATTNSIRSGSGCPKCSGNLPLNNVLIDKKIIDKKLPIKRKGEYNGYHKKLEWECLIDGHIWFQNPAYVLRENTPTGCPKCAGNAKLDNTEIDMVLSKTPLVRINEYMNNQKKIKVKCCICNIELENTLSNFKKILQRHSNNCPNCNKKIRRKEMKNDINKYLESFGVTMLGEYKTQNHSTLWGDSFDNIWEDTPSNVLTKYKLDRNISDYYNHNLPKYTSQSEQNVFDILVNRFKRIERQKRFDSDDRKFFVDFYIEENYKRIVIEYNGIQHYEPVDYFGGYGSFEKQQERDKKLREFCDNNDIILIEIPYNMENKNILSFIDKII